jgi:hypothetical protein
MQTGEAMTTHEIMTVEEERYPEVMTPKQVAKYLQVSESQVHKQSQLGLLPGAFKLGSQWRYFRDELRKPAAFAVSSRTEEVKQ